MGSKFPLLKDMIKERQTVYVFTHPDLLNLWDTYSKEKLLLEAAEEIADAWQYLEQYLKRDVSGDVLAEYRMKDAYAGLRALEAAYDSLWRLSCAS